MRTLLIGLLACATPALGLAQWSDGIRPISGAAVMFGAQGFARPPITTPVTGAYAQVAIRQLLVGAQGGVTLGDGDRSRAAYGLATVGYAQSRAIAWQLYPFLGVGAASFRTSATATADVRPAYAAGFGAEGLLSPGVIGVMIGARIGYITRSLGDDESVAYATIALGIGGRPRTRPPGTVAAARRH